MKRTDLWLVAPFVLCVAVAVVFGVPGIIPYRDETLGRLLSDTIPRLAVGVFLIILMCVRGYGGAFKPGWKGAHLLWSIPCFLVAIVNFPFTALIFGEADVVRTDLLWLFILKCISIALLEEAFFRAVLVPVFLDRFRENKYAVLIAVIGSSALFALVHIVNLFFGAGIGATALQVGYTFLIGCMLAVMLLYTKNIWLCILVHAVFDVGGTIVTDLGEGYFQDLTFWILTAVIGVLCTVHIVLTVVKLTRSQISEQKKSSEN